MMPFTVMTVRSTSLLKLENRNWTRLVQKPNWTRFMAKVKMCTPVHGLSGFSAIKQTESPCTGVHIFTFAPQAPSNLASVPISSDFDFPA
jgi:hypothetical protein